MPLIKQLLENNIKTRIKSLESDFIKKLDGGPLKIQITNSENIYDALGKINEKCKYMGQAGLYNENIVRQISANEWANAIAKQVIELLSNEISKIIADEVDKYIKSATIIIPPGQSVYAADSVGGGVGTTTSPSPPAQIS